MEEPYLKSALDLSQGQLCEHCSRLPFDQLFGPEADGNNEPLKPQALSSEELDRDLLNPPLSNPRSLYKGEHLSILPLSHLTVLKSNDTTTASSNSCHLCSFFVDIYIAGPYWFPKTRVHPIWLSYGMIVCRFAQRSTTPIYDGPPGYSTGERPLCALLQWPLCHSSPPNLWSHEATLAYTTDIITWYNEGTMPVALVNKFEHLASCGNIFHVRPARKDPLLLRQPQLQERLEKAELESIRLRIQGKRANDDVEIEEESTTHQMDQLPTDFRVIDCETSLVCPLPKGQDYLTLSYVWGTGLDTGGPYGALPNTAPKVIRDAASVTLGLGFRYLWVDRYCIPRDQPEEAHVQIRRMDVIYSRSFLTIVAAGASNPGEGLAPDVSGLLSCSWSDRLEQTLSKPLCHLGGFTLHLCIPHYFTNDDVSGDFLISSQIFRHLVERGGGPSLLQGDSRMLTVGAEIYGSAWNTRGWTYQEAVLSRRLLVFTPGFVYFQSHCDPALPWVFQMGLSGIVSPPLFAKVSTAIQQTYWFYSDGASLLEAHVQAYFRRRLTFPSDGYHAFRGIQSALHRSCSDMVMFYGLPIQVSAPDSSPRGCAYELVSALLWEVSAVVVRREGFPSWTWLGWQLLRHGAPVYGPNWIVEYEGVFSTLHSIEVVFGDESIVRWTGPSCVPERWLWGDEFPSLRVEGWTFQLDPLAAADGEIGGESRAWERDLRVNLWYSVRRLGSPLHDGLANRLDELVLLVLAHGIYVPLVPGSEVDPTSQIARDATHSVSVMALWPVGVRGAHERVGLVHAKLPKPWDDFDREGHGWTVRKIFIR